MTDVDPLTKIQTDGIASSFVRAILFGLYLASFAHCVRWLLFEDDGWRVRKKINRTLVATTLFVFFLSTASFSTTAAVGIAHSSNTVEGYDIPAYIWVAIILNDSNAVYSSILIIIDSVLIHRCWIVFSKNWFIICFPLALWCSCLVCAIISFYCTISGLLSLPDRTISNQVVCKAEEVALLTFYVCNIVVSIYTTAVLVFKIWGAAKNAIGTNRLYRTSRILVESGILYTLSSMFFLTYLIEELHIFNMQQTLDSALLLDLLVCIAVPVSTFMPGIAFNLITIRVGEERARGQDTWVDSRDTSEALLSSELHNHPGPLTQQVVESREFGEERNGRIDEQVMEINGPKFRQNMEAERTPEQER